MSIFWGPLYLSTCVIFPCITKLAQTTAQDLSLPFPPLLHISLEVVTGSEAKKQNKNKNMCRHKTLWFAARHGPHQYALVDVPVTDALHADPDDARVSNLFVIEGLRGLWRAAG